MFASVTKWLSGDSETVKSTEVAKLEAPLVDETDSSIARPAKDWSSYIMDAGVKVTKKATSRVVSSATNLKNVNIISDFENEQRKFCNSKEQERLGLLAAVPPWVGCADEDSIKQQITALSLDKRNFLRNPPEGVQFEFDSVKWFPIARVTLEADDNLRKMRFELVPKKLKEDVFWRNYFYRVSLIKQSDSTEVNTKSTSLPRSDSKHSMTRDSTPGEAFDESEFASSEFQHVSSDKHSEIPVPTCTRIPPIEPREIVDGSPEAAVTVEPDDETDWDAELQKELNDFELVTGSNGHSPDKGQSDTANITDEELGDIEREIDSELAGQ